MHDPGWNDPPLLNYDSTAQSSVKKGVLHRPKRVAFPLASSLPSSPATSSSPVSSSMPPRSFPPGLGATPPPPLPLQTSLTASTYDSAKALASNETLIPAIGSSTTELPQDKNEVLTKVMQIFDDIFKTFTGVDREEAEIRKRLVVMKKMWEDDKLDSTVQLRMLQLAEALLDGQDSRANKIQTQVGVDCTTQCSSWIAGIRKLVHLSAAARKKTQSETQHCGDNDKTGNPVAMLDLDNVSQEVVGQAVESSNSREVNAKKTEVNSVRL